MSTEAKRQLKVFLCHASGDKPPVRDLYRRLVTEGVDAWLDQEKLLPGQDWNAEIQRAVREADVVVICLSNKSITKEGYVQREIKSALDIADEKPPGTIFLIPARLEDCVVPERLNRWQWVDLFEENGFIRLLRSLKIRADVVGATIEPLGYESEDQETEHRIDQLYTEGLAAFWVEDWDRACQRFQAILRERPNRKDAAEKLEQAERQRNLAKLYAQATEAYQSENWPTAIKSLEELVDKSGEYKDASQILKDARKHSRLGELYAEAKRLHAAQKWQAVIRIFDQIAGIDTAFPDPDDLLASAQRELLELKRLDELNDLYRKAVHQMDAGQWYEARSLLEQIHKTQIGFLDTERLLRKVEDEILRIEERNKRNIHVNTLYEQTRELIHSKNWRRALEKMEEVHELDGNFVDKDGIFEKAKIELENEERQAQRQRELSAMYAEAVSLLQAKKYQEALEKWNELQAIDPKYKDTSRVKTIAKRKLDELAQPEVAGRPWLTTISSWFRSEPNIPIDRIVLTEKLLLLSFAAIVIIDLVYLVVMDLTHIREAGGLARFLSLFSLGGLYGIVVAFVLSKTLGNWHRKQSLTVIIGWALAQSVPWVIRQYVAVDFITIYALFAGLSTVLAIKWARSATRLMNLIIIFTSWMLAWKVGTPLGIYLQTIFNNQYFAAVSDPFSVLLGLLFTLGFQIEGSWKIVKTAFFGAIGFGVANPIVDMISSTVALPSEVWFALWGIIGGAVLETPAHNSRRIFTSAAICGIGLLMGSLVAFGVLPAILSSSVYSAFSDMNILLYQPFLGLGLGAALGASIRRASAIGVLAILGAGMYMLTRALNEQFFHLAPLLESAIRGALIGFVLGYAYRYMRQSKPVAAP